MQCSEADAFVHAFVDGELAGVDRSSYEQHLLECPQCSRNCRLQARFKAAVRGHLPRPAVPEGLRRRLEVSITSAPPPPRRWRWQVLPKLVPLVAAAGAMSAVVMTARAKPSVALQQAIRTFNSPMPMDVVGSSCASIADWFRGKVDFTVKPPPEAIGTKCEGGRLLPMRDRLAAYLTLQALGGHKLGLLVFDGDEEELETPVRRSVHGLDIYMATHRGASTAAFRGYDGLTYVITGDLDSDSLTNFLQAAFRP